MQAATNKWKYFLYSFTLSHYMASVKKFCVLSCLCRTIYVARSQCSLQSTKYIFYVHHLLINSLYRTNMLWLTESIYFVVCTNLYSHFYSDALIWEMLYSHFINQLICPAGVCTCVFSEGLHILNEFSAIERWESKWVYFHSKDLSQNVTVERHMLQIH